MGKIRIYHNGQNTDIDNPKVIAMLTQVDNNTIDEQKKLNLLYHIISIMDEDHVHSIEVEGSNLLTLAIEHYRKGMDPIIQILKSEKELPVQQKVLDLVNNPNNNNADQLKALLASAAVRDPQAPDSDSDTQDSDKKSQKKSINIPGHRVHLRPNSFFTRLKNSQTKQLNDKDGLLLMAKYFKELSRETILSLKPNRGDRTILQTACQYYRPGMDEVLRVLLIDKQLPKENNILRFTKSDTVVQVRNFLNELDSIAADTNAQVNPNKIVPNLRVPAPASAPIPIQVRVPVPTSAPAPAPITEQNQEKIKLSNYISLLEVKIQDMKKTISEKNEKIKNTETEISQLTGRIEYFEEEINKSKNEIEKIEDQKKQDQIRAVEQAIEEKQRETLTLREQLRALMGSTRVTAAPVGTVLNLSGQARPHAPENEASNKRLKEDMDEDDIEVITPKNK